MYVRNQYHHPIVDVEYPGLKKEKYYWFPYWCKFFAWLLVLSAVTFSSAILIHYGLTFGIIKSYLLISGIIFAFFVGILLFTPVRIALTVLIASVLFKKKAAVDNRKVYSVILFNTYDEEKRIEVEKNRKLNEKLYRPWPLHKLKSRSEDIKYNVESRNLTVDVLIYIVFMTAVLNIVLFNESELSYRTSDVMKSLVVTSSYTNTLSFMEVDTYHSFFEFLYLSLLPSLLLSNDDYNSYKRYNEDIDISKKKKRQASLDEVINRMRNKSSLYERSITMEPAFKLIGIPRLRQLRVSTDACCQAKEVEGRNEKCAEELTFWNLETRNFSLEWEPPLNTTELGRQDLPWIYQSAWETGTLPIVAQFSNYPGGGYILNLAKNYYDSRIIVNYMDQFQWVDMRTRVVFVEFTTYCVNTNTFTVVTLIAERSAVGYFIPSFQIDTCRFIYTMDEIEIINIIMTVLFSLLLFFFLFREGLRIHRTSFRHYLKRAFGILNVTIIACGIFSLLSIAIRSHYVISILDDLEKTSNNKFVSFVYATVLYKWSIYIGALLVCLSSFIFFRLMTYRVLFFRLYATISKCYKHFAILIIQVLIITTAFTIFFYWLLILCNAEFSSYFRAFSTMIGRSVSLDDTFDFKIFNECIWIVRVVYFLFFTTTITIMLVNLFIAVVCFFFHEINKVPYTNKYSIIRYLKYVLTRDRLSDLLPLKGENTDKFKAIRTPVFSKLKTDEKNDNDQILMNDIAKKRPLDVTKYYALPLYGLNAMRALVIAALTDDKEQKKRSRDFALKNYFLYVIQGRHLEESNTHSEKYFLVKDNTIQRIVEKSKLTDMKKLTETLGREKGWALEVLLDLSDSSTNITEKIAVLDKALDLLLEKQSTSKKKVFNRFLKLNTKKVEKKPSKD